MATLKFVQAPTAAIALPMGDSDTEFYGLDIKDINGNYLSMSDFGTIGYMTINPTSPYAEIVSFTGCVYQGDGTTLFTGVTRGLLAIDPYTTGGTAYPHSPNDSLVFSINPQMLDAFVQKGQDATITGTFTFLYTKMPRASQTVTYGVGSDLWFTTKEYVDGVAIAGAPDASTSTKGVTRLSVAPVSATIPIAVGDNDPRIPAADLSGLTQDMIDAIVAGDTPSTANPFATILDLQTGNTKYGTTTGAANTYVLGLTPTLTTLSAGQVIIAKINATNTGASTLNIDSLGAVPIVKLYNQALEAGDLQANQIVEFVYDGTSMQLQSATYPPYTVIFPTITNSTFNGTLTLMTYALPPLLPNSFFKITYGYSISVGGVVLSSAITLTLDGTTIGTTSISKTTGLSADMAAGGMASFLTKNQNSASSQKTAGWGSTIQQITTTGNGYAYGTSGSSGAGTTSVNVSTSKNLVLTGTVSSGSGNTSINDVIIEIYQHI